MNTSWPRLKIATLILCFMVMGTAIFFMGTTLGLKILVKQAQPALLENGIQINPDDIHGRLSSFTLDEFIYHEEIDIHLTGVHLRWDPLSIWFRQISIQELTADTFDMILGDEDKANAREELQAIHAHLNFKMPTIRLHQANFKKFTLKEHDHTEIIQAERIAGDATVTDQNIYFNHLQATWLDFDAKLFGNISLADTRAIDLKGQLSRTTSMGKLDINLFLLFASHLLKIKGDGTLNMGPDIIPLAYELSEKPDHFELVAKDTENTVDHHLDLKVRFDKNAASSWEAALSAKALNVSHLTPVLRDPVDLSLILSGDKTSENVQAKVYSPQHQTTIGGDLRCDKTTSERTCQLNALSLHYENEHWALAKPTPVVIAPPIVDLPHLCMTNALSHVCVKGHYAQAHDFSLSIDSDYFDNKSLDPFIHPMNATGMSQFHLDLKRDSSGLDAKGNVGSDHAILTLDHQPVQFTMFQLKATHHDNASNIALHFLTEKNDTGEVQIELSKQDRDSPHLKGTMDLHLKELNPINLYLSNLYEIEGTIEAKVQLSGTLKEPVYEGSFLIDGSTARIPQLGLVLDHIALDVSGNHNSQIHVKGSAQSGEKGRLALAGAVTLTQQKISSDFTLKGDDLPLIDLPTAQATGSLDLAFQQKQGEAKLSGTVHLYDGKFDGRMLQRRFGSDTDIVFVTDGSVPITEESSSLATAYDIHLIVDDRVRFSGFDVNTQIGGEATIHSSPQGLATANGQFNLINGSYDAYSKHFTIESGSLIYNQSAIDNPSLNVVAEYDLLNTNFSEDGFNKLKITIRVLGSLRQPKLILSSRPQLSQEDILSYLVLGAPLSQAGDNSAPLSQAALAFALKGGSQNVLNNIRKNLGLNQLSLGSITPSSPAASTKSATAGGSEDRGFQDNTAVFIGRAVSPNLYVSYGVGLFNAQQVVRTRLKIGRRWQFITESSNEGEGIDFIYIIERGD